MRQRLNKQDRIITLHPDRRRPHLSTIRFEASEFLPPGKERQTLECRSLPTAHPTQSAPLMVGL